MGLNDLKIGGQLQNGYIIDALHIGASGGYVLAHSPHPDTPEPYVVWNLDRHGDTHTGRYYVSSVDAGHHFRRLYRSA